MKFHQRQLEKAESFNRAHEQLRNEFKPDGKVGYYPPSRYGLRPTSTDTFRNIQSPKTASAYITEEARLRPKNLNPISLAEEDKARKARAYQSKLDNIRNYRSRAEQLASIAEETNEASQLKRLVNKIATQDSYERVRHK
jgi:hypothetical protein